mmetsp:Transcript_39894/g.68468  ORF Transcript_39894/g.68468 Transcript_39894/m.68468 type:complete len:276 (-) Transcript_39894:245-1072(-)
MLRSWWLRVLCRSVSSTAGPVSGGWRKSAVCPQCVGTAVGDVLSSTQPSSAPSSAPSSLPSAATARRLVASAGAQKLTSNHPTTPATGVSGDASRMVRARDQPKRSSKATVCMSTSSRGTASPESTLAGTSPCHPERYSQSSCSDTYAGRSASSEMPYEARILSSSSSHWRMTSTTSSLRLATNGSSSIGASISRAVAGYIFPPGRSHRSRASSTDSTIDSRSKKYPIHSETMTSTCSGSVTSSSVPRTTSTTPPTPLAFASASACRAQPVASTA